MRLTLFATAFCGCLAADTARAADAGAKTIAPATASNRVFNAIDYGAVGDDETDNTAAFSACLKDVIEAGDGRMTIPDGVYRGRIIIPGTKDWITVEIVGASEPTPVFGTIGTFPFPKNGTIIKCVSASGPAVISVTNVPDRLYMQFSGANVSLRNLDVRTSDNPGIGGIDSNIHDPGNLGSGDINYWVVEGNVGAVEKFTKNGGEQIRARRIGSRP